MSSCHFENSKRPKLILIFTQGERAWASATDRGPLGNVIVPVKIEWQSTENRFELDVHEILVSNSNSLKAKIMYTFLKVFYTVI